MIFSKYILILCSIVSIYMLVLFVGFYYSPLSYSEVDLNENGVIGFSEFLYGIEIGKKDLIISNMQCIEYYHLKDGLSAVIKCK